MPFGVRFPSLEKLSGWAQVLKSASITALTAGAAFISAVGLWRALTSNAVVIEPIRVPGAFEERGYTAEIATARLLDEVSSLERRQSSAKDRVSILSRERADELERLQAVPIRGVDAQTIQGAVREAFGIQPRRITGDVTVEGGAGAPTYRVRLRRQPGNQILVDFTTGGEPQAVLQKTALALIEAVDPHIAAGIHWRNRDEENALRMIDVVLDNDTIEDDKYSLNLRGYIHIAHRRYAEALSDFDAIMKLDPGFAPAHFMASWVRLEQKELDLAAAEADRAVELAPTRWWGYFARARVLRERGQLEPAMEMFRKAVELRPDNPWPYLQASAYFLSQGRADDARTIARAGLRVFPENATLRAALGDALSRLGDGPAAGRAYRKALELDPANSRAAAGLAALQQEGR
jgi:hypothetical protein